MNSFRLTKEKAQKLLKQELNLNIALNDSPHRSGIDIFSLTIGHMCIFIENDWFFNNGCIDFEIKYKESVIMKFFNPDTLEEMQI